MKYGLIQIIFLCRLILYRIEMGNTLRNAGVRDIKFGAMFPPCKNVSASCPHDNFFLKIFKLYLDLSDWNIKPRFVETKIDTPRVCLSDFFRGTTSIPFVSLCFYIEELVVFPRGVQGKVMMDIAIGVSVFQYKEEGINVYNFQFGEVSNCFGKTVDECVNTEKCGWCVEKSICLP
jgi:hypothetical protein